MTVYNDVPITYDAIGNPLNDGEWTYTWQHGRQLASMSKDGETVSFVYNEDELRVQKTSTNTGTTKYTLHGKNIVHLTNGNDELHFFYDAQGRVAVVDYNGESYRYMHNLQGDVIALVDEIGNKVVEYWYDAWGKPTNVTGSMAETLGVLQPFRYRGYVWDEEVGLYYLRSRYYRSQLGRFINSDTMIDENIYCYCNNAITICHDNDGTLTEVIINGKTFYGEYYGLSEDLASAIDIILADEKSYAYSKCIGRNEKGKKIYKYGIYKDKGVIRVCCVYLVVGLYGGSKKISSRRKDAVKLTSYDQLEPGMEIFQGNSHIGIVVLFDFGDGEGYRLGVLQSTSTGKFKSYSTTCFENDKNAGPNITPLTPDNFNKKWKYVRTPSIDPETAFFFNPRNKFYLWEN